VAYTIKKVALNVIIACFYARGNADTKVAIFADEVVYLLSPGRHIGSIEIL
jgi:hypothetical protein